MRGGHPPCAAALYAAGPHVQLGNVVFPKSVTRSRIEENYRVFDFELDESDMASISGLDAGNRLGPDPDGFN